MATSSYLASKAGDPQAVQRLIQSITSNIQKIAQNVNQIETMNGQIGTPKDSESLRDRLLQTENFTNQLVKETSNQLKELNLSVRSMSSNSSGEERQFKIQKEKLTDDLVKTLKKFQDVQKLSMLKQRESNERARANIAAMSSPTNDGIKMNQIRGGNNNNTARQLINFGDDEMGTFENTSRNENPFLSGGGTPRDSQQVQIQMENEVDMAQLREREAALRKLENDIVDVNMIFKDLAVMVHDQGEMIDSIESNVEAVQMRVQSANTHLESAKVNQQKARKKKCILLMILSGIVAVILLVIILSIKSS